jgi:hypothetical protein
MAARNQRETKEGEGERGTWEKMYFLSIAPVTYFLQGLTFEFFHNFQIIL